LRTFLHANETEVATLNRHLTIGVREPAAVIANLEA